MTDLARKSRGYVEEHNGVYMQLLPSFFDSLFRKKSLKSRGGIRFFPPWKIGKKRRYTPAMSESKAKGDDIAVAITEVVGVESRIDIEYGTLPMHKLDLHIPPSVEGQPGQKNGHALVCFIHGGAWRAYVPI